MAKGALQEEVDLRDNPINQVLAKMDMHRYVNIGTALL